MSLSEYCCLIGTHQFESIVFFMQALVECDGESIDLSGDVGAVGRVVISDNPSGNHDMFFDLKGK